MAHPDAEPEPRGAAGGRAMTEPAARNAKSIGGEFRVWEKGSGAPVGFFAGLPGLPRWLPMLDLLAETRRVVAPSLPGTSGGHDAETLDEHLDWILAARDAHRGAGIDGGDLIGASAGGALAAEIAACWPESVRRLVLIAPFGVFDEDDPIPDVFAQRPGRRSPLLSNRPEELDAYIAADDGLDADTEVLEWDIMMQRANTAAARYLWPLGDTRLIKRLGRITCPTLLLRGEDDRVIPQSYAARLAEAISGPVSVQTIPGAGHTAEIDAPEAVAQAVLAFIA